MQTITIKTTDSAFAKTFVKGIKQYKEIQSVSVTESAVYEPIENYAAPGKPMSTDTFEKRIRFSEESPLISYKEAEEVIDSWLKRKKK